jgi:thiol-disulfide isomerase/thioredoxin
MRRLVLASWAFLALGGWLVSAGAAMAADRPAEEILKELKAVKAPVLDRTKTKDQAYVQDYVKQRQETIEKRSTLILELYKADPDHKEIPTLMAERWSNMPLTGLKVAELKKELDDAIAHGTSEKLKLEAMFIKARVMLVETRANLTVDLKAVEEFIKSAPKDPRVGSLLYMAASLTKDEKAKTAIEDRILKELPESQYTTRIEGTRRKRESIGKPFDLEFTDAISGSTVSMKGLKGKVVVIDFWATWCGPCVGEMPTMKEIYAKYHDKGVEFIGISLDSPKEEGGLDELKKFVKENEIAWPQYYQGKGWQSAFSSSWGINAIPTMFIVDTEGKIYSLEARGQLEKLIPELLKKKDAPAGAGAGAGGE